MITALIYTEGVFFAKDGQEDYCLLELAYCDIDGNHYLFYVQSPISKCKAVKLFDWQLIRKTMGAVICPYTTWKGNATTTVDQILDFLQNSYKHFSKHIPNVEFAYLGSSRHRYILDLAKVPSVNLEELGCPHISKLAIPVSTPKCRFHPYGRICARDKLGAMHAWFNTNAL